MSNGNLNTWASDIKNTNRSLDLVLIEAMKDEKNSDIKEELMLILKEYYKYIMNVLSEQQNKSSVDGNHCMDRNG